MPNFSFYEEQGERVYEIPQYEIDARTFQMRCQHPTLTPRCCRLRALRYAKAARDFNHILSIEIE